MRRRRRERVRMVGEIEEGRHERTERGKELAKEDGKDCEVISFVCVL